MKEAIKWLGIATWFVVLLLGAMYGMAGYHRFVLANASYQQLLVENNQRLEAQQIQIHDAKQQRGMVPPAQPEAPQE